MALLRYFITSKAKRNMLRFFFTNVDSSFYTRQVARLTGEPLNAVRRELGHLEKAGLLHSYMQGNQKYYGIIQSFPFLAEWKKIILESEALAAPRPAVAGNSGADLPPHLSRVITRIELEKHPEDSEKIVRGAQVVMHQSAESGAEEGQEVNAPTAIASTGEGQQTAFHTMTSFIKYLKDQFMDISAITLTVVHGDSARSNEMPATGVDLLVVGDTDKDALLEIIANIEDSTGVGINLTRMTRSDFDYRNAKGDPLIRRIWGEKKLVVKGRQSER